MSKPDNGLRRWAFRRRNAAQVLGTGGIWGLIASVRPRNDFAGLSKEFQHTGVKSADARILEVGCGSGRLLRTMASVGFTNVVGIDPYVPREERFASGLRILATTLERLDEGDFDLIIFNHSLEHMAEQVTVLRHASQRLRGDGTCIVRVPIADSDPWRRYQADWVELDAPRHFVIHTRRSLAAAAKSAGLGIVHTVFEETYLGYWGSELYKRDMSLIADGRLRDPADYFTRDRLEDFKLLAATANSNEAGGRAAFFLRPISA